ncbi:unnamed protein product [Caenorhabditis angaria]|uniref:G-protein coupled receptors family 1 profile domain-containing protein n=1 Tax=Caenorhabditis angaria TaxID=860376 RepID=A0A9P1IA23_9PELO|nr:unnamed protein product [Caenorhabditis angaria]
MTLLDLFKMSTSETDDEALIARSLLYIGCGFLVLLPNAFCIIVFNSSKEFRQKFVFFTMLSLSDMINGISFILAGMGRYNLILAHRFHIQTSKSECITQFVWPIFMLIGGQLPATFHCLLTVERVLAVNRVSWYRSHWSWRHRMYLTILGITGCVALNLLAIWISYHDESRNSDRICAVFDSTGIIYGTAHYILIAFSYLIAFVVTLNLFWKSHKSKFLNTSERRKQMAILILSGINVIMVSFPNTVLVADEWHGKGFNVLFVGIAYLLYGIQSCFNLPIFYFFRLEFKRRLHDIFRCQYPNSVFFTSNNEMSRQQISRVGPTISRVGSR